MAARRPTCVHRARLRSAAEVLVGPAVMLGLLLAAASFVPAEAMAMGGVGPDHGATDRAVEVSYQPDQVTTSTATPIVRLATDTSVPPTTAPTRAPTRAPTLAPTSAPTLAATRAPTEPPPGPTDPSGPPEPTDEPDPGPDEGQRPPAGPSPSATATRDPLASVIIVDTPRDTPTPTPRASPRPSQTPRPSATSMIIMPGERDTFGPQTAEASPGPTVTPTADDQASVADDPRRAGVVATLPPPVIRDLPLGRLVVEEPGVRRAWDAFGPPHEGRSWISRFTANRPGPLGSPITYAALVLLHGLLVVRVIRGIQRKDFEHMDTGLGPGDPREDSS